MFVQIFPVLSCQVGSHTCRLESFPDQITSQIQSPLSQGLTAPDLHLLPHALTPLSSLRKVHNYTACTGWRPSLTTS